MSHGPDQTPVPGIFGRLPSAPGSRRKRPEPPPRKIRGLSPPMRVTIPDARLLRFQRGRPYIPNANIIPYFKFFPPQSRFCPALLTVSRRLHINGLPKPWITAQKPSLLSSVRRSAACFLYVQKDALTYNFLRCNNNILRIKTSTHRPSLVIKTGSRRQTT